MKYLGLINFFVLMIFPAVGYAFEADYYTYNGFQETVDAFTRISFIFNDINYTNVIYSTSVLGVLVGGALMFGKGLSGEPIKPLSWLAPVIVGVIVYQGLIIPKDKIHIYDTVLNAYQPVTGIPDGIILVASLLNKVERIFIDIVDTNTVNPWASYSEEAGGISFKLIEQATSQKVDVNDTFLTKSIKEYYNDCGILSLGIPGSTVTINELRRGTSDMRATMAKMNSLSLSTKYYTPLTKWGELMTCAQAWTKINVLLVNVNTWDEPISSICSKSGFNSGSASQMVQCKSQLAKAREIYGLVGGSAINYVRNSYLSNKILEETMSGSADSAQQMLASRNIMMQAVGSSAMINEWMPRVRAWILSIILGLTPLIAIFIVTPLFFKALSVFGGLMIWFSVWGIIDVILHAGAVDASFRAFEQINDYQLGLDAIWLSPEASVQALSTFGQSRAVAMVLSGVIVSALFKLSIGSSLASLGSTAINSAGGEGRSAAMAIGTTEGQGTLVRRSVDGGVASRVFANNGMDSMSSSSAFEESTRIAGNTRQLSDGMSLGLNSMELSKNIGAMSTMPVDRMSAASNMLKMQGKEATADNLHEFQSSLNNINAGRSISDPIAYRQAVARVFGNEVINDDERFMEGAIAHQTFNHLSSVNAASSLQKAASLIGDKVYDSTGLYPAETDIMRNLQDIMHGDTLGKINALEGNGSEWVKHQTHSQIKSTSTLGAEFDGYQNNDTTPQEVYKNLGVKSAAENIGVSDAVKEFGTDSFNLASHKETASKAAEADAWKENIVDDKFDGNIKAAEEFLVSPNVAESFSKAQRLQAVADDWKNGDIYKAALSMGSTDEQFTVSASEFRDFVRQNPDGFSKEQLSIIDDADQFNMVFSHDGQGNYSNIHGNTGTEVGINKTSSIDTSDKVRAGSELNNSVREMLLGNSFDSKELLESNVLQNVIDPERREAFFQSWAGELEHIATSNSTDATTLRLGGEASISGYAAKVMSAMGVSANVTGSAAKEWSDHTSFNSIRSAVEDRYTTMETDARTYAGNVTSNKAEEDELFSSIFSSSLREYHSGIMDELRNQAHEEIDGNTLTSISEVAENNKVGKILRDD